MTYVRYKQPRAEALRDWLAEYGWVAAIALVFCLWVGALVYFADEIWIRDCAEHRPLKDCKADRAEMTGRVIE